MRNLSRKPNRVSTQIEEDKRLHSSSGRNSSSRQAQKVPILRTNPQQISAFGPGKVSIANEQDLGEESAHSISSNGAIDSLEIDGVNSDEAASWAQRVSWFRGRLNHRDPKFIDSLTYSDCDAVYQGGAMEAEFHRSKSSPSAKRNASHTGASVTSREIPTGSDDDSLADFQESEWTPPDSSYGAAIPVAGWIPKHIRRTIEASLIALSVLGLVFVIVTTSMRITDETNKKHNSSYYEVMNNQFDTAAGATDDLSNVYSTGDYNSKQGSQYSDDAVVASSDDKTRSSSASENTYYYYQQGINKYDDDYYSDDFFNNRR